MACRRQDARPPAEVRHSRVDYGNVKTARRSSPGTLAEERGCGSRPAEQNRQQGRMATMHRASPIQVKLGHGRAVSPRGAGPDSLDGAGANPVVITRGEDRTAVAVVFPAPKGKYLKRPNRRPVQRGDSPPGSERVCERGVSAPGYVGSNPTFPPQRVRRATHPRGHQSHRLE